MHSMDVWLERLCGFTDALLSEDAVLLSRAVCAFLAHAVPVHGAADQHRATMLRSLARTRPPTAAAGLHLPAQRRTDGPADPAADVRTASVDAAFYVIRQQPANDQSCNDGRPY